MGSKSNFPRQKRKLLILRNRTQIFCCAVLYSNVLLETTCERRPESNAFLPFDCGSDFDISCGADMVNIPMFLMLLHDLRPFTLSYFHPCCGKNEPSLPLQTLSLYLYLSTVQIKLVARKALDL